MTLPTILTWAAGRLGELAIPYTRNWRHAGSW